MMQDTLEGLNRVFKVKVDKFIKDFLGCEIIQLSHGMALTQKRIIERLLKDNKVDLKSEKFKTPSAPVFL